MSKYLVFVFVFLVTLVFGQRTEKYNSKYANFYRAEELFQKDQFGAARKEFRDFVNAFDKSTDPLYQKALYYEALSALELYNNDAVKLLEEFNRTYPESIYKKTIYFKLGQYYYQKKEYSNSIIWLDKLKKPDLEPEIKDEYFFKLGHSYFLTEQYPAARNAFYETKDDSTQYGNPALYYFSHIAYQDKSYQVALEGFLKLKETEQFGQLAPYYIVQIYHAQGRYKDVITFYPSVKDSLNLINQNDINHIVGDSYYKLNQYEEAIPYLLAYNNKTHTNI